MQEFTHHAWASHTPSIRFLDSTLIFETEFHGIILALQKVPASISKVVTLTDSLSVMGMMILVEIAHSICLT